MITAGFSEQQLLWMHARSDRHRHKNTLVILKLDGRRKQTKIAFVHRIQHMNVVIPIKFKTTANTVVYITRFELTEEALHR